MTTSLVILLCLSYNNSYAIDQKVRIVQLQGVDKDSAFKYPKLELNGRVGELFEFSDVGTFRGCNTSYKRAPSKLFLWSEGDDAWESPY